MVIPLEKVLSHYDVVLVDPSARRIGSYSRSLKEAKSYDSIDKEDLEIRKAEVEKLAYILGHPSAMTLPEITCELDGFVGFLKGTISDFSANYDSSNASETAKTNKELLDQVRQEAEKVCTLSRQKHLIINHPCYDALVGMVKLLSKSFDLKKPAKQDDDPYVSDTDERIVAAIYFENMYHSINPALLSNDEDFKRLLGVTPRLLGSPEFFPHNEGFRECFKAYSFRLYITRSREECARSPIHKIKKYEKVVGSERQVKGKPLSRPVQVQIARKLDELWTRFNSQSSSV